MSRQFLHFVAFTALVKQKRPFLLSSYSFFFRVSVWSDRITAMIDSCCSQAPSQVYQQAIDLKGFLQIYNNDWLHQGLTNRKYHRFKKNFKIPSQVYWNWCWGYFWSSFGDYGLLLFDCDAYCPKMTARWPIAESPLIDTCTWWHQIRTATFFEAIQHTAKRKKVNHLNWRYLRWP